MAEPVDKPVELTARILFFLDAQPERLNPSLNIASLQSAAIAILKAARPDATNEQIGEWLAIGNAFVLGNAVPPSAHAAISN